MALIPDIQFPDKAQIGEKVRFDGSKSYVTKGSNPITTMTVATFEGASTISIFDADVDERYLDYTYYNSVFFTTDIVAGINDKIDFNEGGAQLTATVAAGAAKSLSTLASDIKTAMDSAGANTYTVSYDDFNKITISADGNFELMTGTGTNQADSLLPQIGFPFRYDGKDEAFGNTITGNRTEYVLKEIELTIGDGASTATMQKYLMLYDKDGDALFSDDSMLRASEPDILKWTPDGYNSWNYVHRESQELIIAWLDEKGMVNSDGKKFVKADIVDIEEFRQWSKFMTLRIIFEGLSNAVDDIFAQKAIKYGSLESQHKNRALIRIDIDGDGKIDNSEHVRIHSVDLFRR